ncbi:MULTISPECIES: YitT family protein [unclassified Acinetobacter]|uniref:YitT family protein n=1 Tax=unclassified Acinetobacter TaxID=196816 RepID=UPI0035B6C117
MTQATHPDQDLTQMDENNISHSLLEDAFAVIIGTAMIGFALLLLQQSHVMVGGTVGLSLLIQKITHLPFSIIFWVVNLPFYYLAYLRLGKQMLIKTIIAVSTLSVMTEIHPLFLHLDTVQPLYASIVANTLIGLGLLILFRHRARVC